MTKRQISMVIIALLLLTVEVACMAHADSAYTMGFHNNSDRTMEYTLYKLKRINPLVSNEIEAVEKGKLVSGKLDVITMPAGAYYIAWFEEGGDIVISGMRFIHFTPTTFVFE